MKPIQYIDRMTGKRCTEKVYGGAALHFLYGGSALGKLLRGVVAKNPLFSSLYGKWVRSGFSRRLIAPFIKKFDIETSECAETVESFQSFNDFFIRKLKAECRPIEGDLVIPADGRYIFFPNIDQADGFIVKGKRFSLSKLLRDEALAEQYSEGAMVMARLCPTDYHRFHFPCRCTPGASRLINGYLYSVNPVAVRSNIEIFTENKRVITELHTEAFGNVLYIEVGATNVGSITQTFQPHRKYEVGEEKGFFAFGASALILLFEKGQITFADDLLTLSQECVEIRCLLGQKLGNSSRGSGF